MTSRNQYLYLFIGIYTILFLLTMQNPFFWDTLHQASRVGLWYYDSGFDQLLLPDNLDSGHPPFFGIYLALCWTLFGKNLLISHLAVLPFVIGIVWQVHRLINYYFSDEWYLWVMAVVLLDAILMTQVTLVSPDLVLVFCFVWAWNSLLRGSKWYIVAVIGMTLMSIRGLFAMATLFIFHFLSLYGNQLKAIFSRDRDQVKFERKEISTFLFLIFSLIPALVYYYYHYTQTGWWISTPGESWGGHRAMVDLSGFVKNGVILGWKLVDVGRVVIVLLTFFLLGNGILKKNKLDIQAKSFLLMVFSFIVAYAPALLLFQNPIAHRYLMPLVIAIGLLGSHLLIRWKSKKVVKGFFIFIILFQLSGHLWVYPKKIAQGWDASLAYLSYFESKEKMLDKIDELGINYQSIGTQFPAVDSKYVTSLSDSKVKFKEKDLSTDQYILYSNVINDFADEEIDDLENNWQVIHQENNWPVIMILYQRK